MNQPSGSPSPIRFAGWLVVVIASIGFLFDTYELLMFPLIAGPAVSELLQLPPSHPEVTKWVGNMIWITALCGGVFGLMGGWLVDRLGRKTVLALSIALYSFSPAFAALSTSLGGFIFFRSATFVGVCVEFVAAVTWLAELFPDRKQKEFALGFTQAFASVGGILVTLANTFTVNHAAALAALPVADPMNAHASWRYTLLTGLIPAVLIGLLLPFVPESAEWKERRAAGALKRPSFGELFSPALRRTTLVSTLLSACAYAAAFGALQLTPTRIVPGLSELEEHRKALKPIQDETKAIFAQFDAAQAAFEPAAASTPGLRELAARRARARQAITAAKKASTNSLSDDAVREAAKTQLAGLTNQMAGLDKSLGELTASAPDAKKALLDREKALALLAANRTKQEPHDTAIKAVGNTTQFHQEMGGLAGRLALAVLVITAMRRGAILRLFLIPGVVILPLTYAVLYNHGASAFQWGIAVCGFLTVAQFSYFGEYLPKVFPIHLRGTGGGFATNVGGRMIGTSAAFLTTNLLAPQFGGSTYEQVRHGAVIVGGGVFVIALIASFFLPEPANEGH
jgi:MFS family permease